MKIIFPFFTFLLFTFSSSAQYNQDSLTARFEKVDALFVPYTKPSVPGCAVGIIKDGKYIYEKYFGFADINNKIPIDKNTRFNLCSNSKQFTAACILLLQEEGKLSLNDDFKKYFPEISSLKYKISIRQLMTHTSGMREHYRTMRMLGLNKGNFNTAEKALEIVSKEKELNFLPGEAYYYNNTSYALLAEIVKRVSGISFKEYQEKNIFQPLEMSSTFLIEQSKKKPDAFASAYYQDGARKDKKLKEIKNWTFHNSQGPGSVYSNLGDLLHWDENFCKNKLGKKDPTFIDSMYSAAKLNNGKSSNYAAGLMHASFRGYEVIKHGGDMFSYHTFIWRIPSENFTVIILANTDDIKPWELVRKITSIILDPKVNLPSYLSESDSALIKKLYTDKQGVYLDPELKDDYTLKLQNGKLFVDNNQAYVSAPNEFYTFGYTLTKFKIIKNEAGPKYSLLVDSSRICHLTNGYDTLTNLKDFVGVYENQEWKSEMKVSVKKGKLKISWKNNEIIVNPLFKDSFFNQYNDRFFFMRDAKGTVIGFNYSTERAMNFMFYKK